MLRVSQQPYQPVSVRIYIKATVGHEIWVGIKIFDTAGHRLSACYGRHHWPEPRSVQAALLSDFAGDFTGTKWRTTVRACPKASRHERKLNLRHLLLERDA